jgi:hypothetical protein
VRETKKCENNTGAELLGIKTSTIMMLYRVKVEMMAGMSRIVSLQVPQ